MSGIETDKIEEIVEEQISRGRIERRKYELFKNTDEKLKEDWVDLNYIIKVHRVREFKNIKSEEIAYFITNKSSTIKELAKGIRNHWLIENSLHWVKDVTFGEDKTRHKEIKISENKSILMNFAINILRAHENKYLKRTMRLCCNDITCLMSFLE